MGYICNENCFFSGIYFLLRFFFYSVNILLVLKSVACGMGYSCSNNFVVIFQKGSKI